MSNDLKASNYNFLFDLDDGTHLAFSAMSGGFVKISNDNYESVKQLLTDPAAFEVENDNDKSMLESAKRARFVIESDVDEFQLLKFRENIGKYSTGVFHLTIMPTLDCNFACPYCYENPKKGKMSPEAQKGLCLWVEEKLEVCKEMSVAWFGGEPLMALDVIRNLTREFKRLCKEHKVKFTANMTTNGYYLVPKFIREMEELSINLVQVTIDGPPESHDTRRKLRNGKGTFQKIVSNLTTLCEMTDDVNIAIRVNFDARSFETIPGLFPLIPEPLRLRSQIYFRQVYPPPQFWDAQAPIGTSSVPREAEGVDFTSLLKEAQDHGFRVLLSNFSPHAGYCEADYINHFVVDPECNLHKCTVAFDEEHRIGHITPEGKAIMNIPILAKWMLRDTVERSNCKDCKILPLCMGGCSFSTLCSKGRVICSTLNDEGMTVENLKMLYKNMLLEKSREASVKSREVAEATP